MDSPGNRHPTRVVPEIRVVPVKTVGIEGSFRRRAEPKIVVHSRRRIAIRRTPETVRARAGGPEDGVIQLAGFALIPAVEAVNQADSAERPVLNEPRGISK